MPNKTGRTAAGSIQKHPGSEKLQKHSRRSLILFDIGQANK